MISVVIPVKNGGEPMRRLLEAIRSQEVSEEVEIVAVDSGSTDGTQEQVRSVGGRVHEIAPGEFNHGETRNLGARLAEGEIVVFTVDDALPVGSDWLERMTAPLREESALAAAYARQVAYPDAPPHQHFYIDYRYGPDARIQRASSPEDLTAANVLFSNVSSAIRRPLLLEHPFASDIVIAEDLEWSSRILLGGHAIAYVPGAVVRHSHDYTLRDAIKRYFDQGAAARRIYRRDRASSRSVRGEGLALVREEFAWLWRRERTAIPYALAHEIARFTGFQLGVHHRRVPRRLRPRISRTPVYWS